MNTLGSVPRRGQWRFRRIFRGADARGRLDVADDGLIDFSTCSEVAFTVTPRAPHRGCWNERDPVLSASLTAGTLVVANPGIVEAMFPESALRDIPPGLYDVRIDVTVGAETSEIFDEPVDLV